MERKAKDETAKADEANAGLPKRDGHATMGATTLSGAVTGAVLGAMAGPVGAVAGGIIGSAVGAMTGAAMEKEDHRQEAHDQKLDEDIGVTDGSIGVPDSMKHPSPETLREAAKRG